uniref:D-2-hydroxyglutarate dehydrogenase, mitochondrial n=1 Tax=Globodera rostochiensis TaxID=31243 RepID=A0A914HRP8_GLORO
MTICDSFVGWSAWEVLKPTSLTNTTWTSCLGTKVSAVLKHCYHRRLAVVPQAGNTGLVGGSVPVHDEIVLSIKKITSTFLFDDNSGVLDCDAGFILEDADVRLAKDGFMVPIDLGAKGSCLIGGITATNAGGIRLIRYGSMHSHVLGMEVVIPDKHGTVLKLGSNLRKDNTDLHLHKLFVGSEGQLGVITRIQMQTVPKPNSVQSAFLGVHSFKQCLAILRTAKQMLNEILSSFEFIDGETMQMVEQNAGLRGPLSVNSVFPFYLLIETSGTESVHDLAKMDQFLDKCIDNELAADGVLAKNVSEAEHLWKIRENCSLGLRQDGYVFKHDLSLPLEHFYELTEQIRERLCGTNARRVCTFGHLGDGNAHLNVTTPKFDEGVYQRLYPFIYEWVVSKGGSISAEHGIGRLKREYHHKLLDPQRRMFSSNIKRLFDPRMILSPYKMID